MWNHVIGQLGGTSHADTFDARGRGRSGTSSDYSLSGAIDVVRVIEATPLPRPILVGWSHSATIALRYAADYPEMVAGLSSSTAPTRSPCSTERARRAWAGGSADSGGSRPFWPPSHDRVTVVATTMSDHARILAEDPGVVAAAIEDVAGRSMNAGATGP